MYKIIGGDGREYGPVTEAELLKWIAEGRLGAQSLAKAESDAEFRALGTFPEFADALGLTAAAASTVPMDWDKHDYELDIGGCIGRGWTLFMDNFGILLGCTALYLLIFMGAPGVVNAILAGVLGQIVPATVQYSASYMILQNIVLQSLAALAAGPMTGGYCYLLIQALRGNTITVGDLFVGFQKAYSRLYAGSLIINLLMIVCFIPFTIVFAARAGPVLVHLKNVQQNPGDMRGLFTDLMSSIASTGPIILLCLIPALYLVTSLWFTIPLIIDQGMDVWTAIRTSFKMVHKHWLTVFGLVFLTTIIYLAGFILCCVPAIFTVGVATAACMFAYETIFCQRRPD